MPESELTSLDRRQQGIAGNNYSILGAQDDPTVTALARLLGSKTGFSQGLFKDLIMLIQALAGIENKGVVMAQNVKGAMQQYGAPGVVGNTNGFIGGNDVTSMYATEAMRQQVLKSFTNPVTGLPNSSAYGLNTGEMGQAAALAMSSGFQYASGGGPTAFRAGKVDDLRKQAELGKDDQMLNQLKGLDANSYTTVFNSGWAEKTKAAVGQAASVLGSIKEVLGSEALKNLGHTSEKLFGTTNINEFGFDNARKRMTEIQAYGDMFYGGGPEGRKTAAVAFQTTADFAGGGVYGAHAAAYAQRMAAAGGLASAQNQGVLNGFGYSKAPVRQEKLAATIGQDLNIIKDQEIEQLAMETAIQEKGTRLTETQKNRASALRQQFIDAGGDQIKIAKARQGMAALTHDLSGESISRFAFLHHGKEGMEAGLTEVGMSHLHETQEKVLSKRLQDNLFSIYTKDKDLHSLGLAGNSGARLAMAGANLTGANLSAVIKSLQNGGGDLKTIMANNPAIAQALSAAGIKPEQFVADATQKGKGGAAADAMLSGSQRANAFVPEFIGTEAQAQHQQQVLKSMTMGRTLGPLHRGDLVEEMLKGYYGQHDWTNSELTESLLKKGGKDVTSLKMNKFGISAESKGELEGILGKKGMKEMGIGDDNKWFDNVDNQIKLAQKLDTLGAYTVSEGGGRFATKDTLDKERGAKGAETRQKMLTDLSQRGGGNPRESIYGLHTHKSHSAIWKEDPNETPEEADKRFKKTMRGLVNEKTVGGIVDDAASSPTGKSHLESLLKQGVLGDDQKKTLSEEIKKKNKAAHEEQNNAYIRYAQYYDKHKGDEGLTKDEEFLRRRKAHQDSSEKVASLDSLSAAINGGTAMTVSNMVVNGMVSLLGGFTNIGAGSIPGV